MLDFIDKHFGVLAFLVGLLACVPVLKVTGDPIAKIVEGIAHEFSNIVKAIRSPSALNALGGLVSLVVALAVILRGPLEVLGGQIDGHDASSSASTATLAIRALLVPLILIYFLASMEITRQK